MKKNYNRNWLFKLKSTAMLSAMLFAGTAMAQLSGTYTVNSGAATSGTNYASFSALASALSTSGVSGAVTVNVVAGTYSGQMELKVIPGASSTNTITINGNGQKLSTTSSEAVIEFNGADYVTIDDLTIEAAGTGNGTRGVWFHNNSDYNTISNCDIIFSKYTGTSNSTGYITFSGSATSSTSSGNHGIKNVITNNIMKGASNSYGPYYGFSDFRSNSSTTIANVFTNNDVRDIYYYCVYQYRSNGMTIENNKFHTSRSGANYSYGVYAYYCGTTTDQISISNNEFSNLSGLYVYLSYIYQTTGTSALPFKYNDNQFNGNDAEYYLYGNRLYYCDYSEVNGNEMAYNDAGYYIYYAFLNYYNDNSEMLNNIYHNNYGGYGELYTMYVGYANNTKYAHNTIALGDVSGGYFYYNWYVLASSAYSNLEFKNNILTCTTNPGYGYAYPARFLDGGDYSGNVVYLGTGTYTKYLYAGNTAYGTLTAWQDALDDGAVFIADPQYTNLGAGDLKPKNPKIANIGAQGMAAVDYDGITRTACGPDPGAYEFYVDHSASNATTLPTSECGGYTTQLEVDFTNGTNVAMTDVPMYYSINGNRVDETIDNVAASTTVTHAFASEPVFNTPGVNTVVIGLGCDDDASNNVVTQTITITPSPSGADLVQSSTWNGYFRTGNMADPDVTVPDYEVIYDVQSPSKYTTAGLGSDWTVANNSMIVGGASVGAAEGVVLDATAGTLSVDPVAALQGKTLYLSVVISDVNTGCDSTIGRYMYVPFTPVVDFEETDICLGDVAQFKNKSTLAGPDYMLNTWDFDDPDPTVTDDNSDIQDGFWSYTKFGTADVTLTVVNGQYPLFEYSITKTITVTPKPVVDFKVLNKCFGTPIEFNNKTAMPDGTTAGITYNWDFSHGTASTAVTPTKSYPTPGQRVVTLTASKSGCSSTVSKNAYQFETPTADFSSIGACNFEEIEFANGSTIPNGANMGYAWDFGDGGISRFPNPAHAFATAGSKSVKLTVTSEFGCVNEVTKTITLNESPEADFTWDKACNLTPINFTRTGSVPNGGANTSYTWNFNNQGTSGMENPQHLFPKVGAKKVTLTASDLNGCSSSITKEVAVVLQAVADFEASSVCEGDEAVFTNKSTVAAGNLQYQWKFGDGMTSTDLSPRHRYAITGTTQIIGVTLEAIVPGGCSDQVTKSITVNAAPDASFTPDVQGRTVAFDGPSGNSIYQWRFGDGSKATTEDPTYTYTNVDKGSFEVCLATKNAECWSEECQTITINLAGVEELTENNDMITVYPNPNNGSFNLTIDNAKADVVIKVGDLLGNVIPANVVNNLNGKYSVDLSAVASGVYFVQVKNGNYYATKRITVSK